MGFGCATGVGEAVAFPENAERTTAPGDWDDIDSAVVWGGDRAEWVVYSWWNDGSDRRLYRLRNAAGTSALLQIERGAEGRLRLKATVGPLGDSAAELELISVVTRRLEQLHGVDTAEIK